MLGPHDWVSTVRGARAKLQWPVSKMTWVFHSLVWISFPTNGVLGGAYRFLTPWKFICRCYGLRRSDAMDTMAQMEESTAGNPLQNTVTWTHVPRWSRIVTFVGIQLLLAEHNIGYTYGMDWFKEIGGKLTISTFFLNQFGRHYWYQCGNPDCGLEWEDAETKTEYTQHCTKCRGRGTRLGLRREVW